ncbi:MAG: hypothetical protein NTX03_07065 [Bacteroidetes bacterium]|nr:hypothetical protein [Bacteroidota bacterium]
MRAFKRNILLAFLLAFVFASCKKETTEKKQTIVYDNVIYHVDTIPVYKSAAEKTRQKTANQYYSILYSDLFQKSIPSKELADLTQLSLSIGDKKLVNEMMIKNYLITAIIPTDAEMRKDIDKFINLTYLKFYLRKPTQLELYFFRDMITNDTKVTPTNIYTSFTLSNEYLYY